MLPAELERVARPLRVVDPSPDALAMLGRRLQIAGARADRRRVVIRWTMRPIPTVGMWRPVLRVAWSAEACVDAGDGEPVEGDVEGPHVVDGAPQTGARVA